METLWIDLLESPRTQGYTEIRTYLPKPQVQPSMNKLHLLTV